MRRVPRSRRFLVTSLAVAATCAPLLACGSGGRDLKPPKSDQTLSIVTTSTAASTTAAPGKAPTPTQAPAGGAPFALLLPWDDGGPIDPVYTCKGTNERPSISWSNVPANAKELALVVTDDNAGGFVHWLVAGLSPSVTGIDAGDLPDGAVESKNNFDSVGWKGPCPPSGTHTYRFRLYALAAPSGVTESMAPDAAVEAVRKNIVALITRTGLVSAA